MLKEIHFSFDRRAGALRWTWPATGDETRLELECLDWLNETRVIDRTELRYRDFALLYLHSGWRPRGVDAGVPMRFRIREMFADGSPANCLEKNFPGEGSYAIRWWVQPDGTGMHAVTVEYPQGLSVATYPEKLLSFAVRPVGCPNERPARLYLPKPDETRLQTFVLDPTRGWQAELELNRELPLGSGSFTAEEIFRLERV